MKTRTAVLLVPAILGHVGTAAVIATAARPAVTALAVLAFAFINPALLPPIAELGELSLRYADLVFLLLIVGFLALSALRPLKVADELGQLFAPVLPFLAWIAVSLLVVAVRTPALLEASATSYLRLLQTVTLGVFAHLAFRTKSDLRLFQNGFVVFSVASVVIGLGQLGLAVARHGPLALAFRYGSVLGEPALGLVAGLLILLGVLRRGAPEARLSSTALLIIGSLGLFLAKAASPTLATAVSVAVFFALRGGLNFVSVAKALAIATLVIGVAAYVVTRWRSEDIAGLVLLTGGSYAQRLMIYYAGIQIFLAHPLFGVGWMTTGTSPYIGSPEFNSMLMTRFPRLPEWYFFLDEPQSLHNMYLQFLAELGLVGFTLAAIAIVAIGRAAIHMLRSVSTQSALCIWARFYLLSFVFLLIWWNTGPLFGGQTESVLLFVLMGVFASTVALARGDKNVTEARTL